MRYLVPAFLFVILIVFFWVGLSLDPTAVPSPLIGKPAPAWVLPRLDDTEQLIDDSSLRGRVSLFNVWATWCVGCRQEHDMLLQIAAQGVPIIGLNWNDNREDALAWLDRLGDPYVFSVFDGVGDVGLDWGVYGAPETFVVDAEGRVRHKQVGPITPEIWETELSPLIVALKAEM